MPSAQAGYALLLSDAHRQQGNLAEASDHLQLATRLATEHRLHHILEVLPDYHQRLEQPQ